uniref:ShKT domain-containing protein n=1 Tax=Meloidogyne incognita TaxID=6306 RepID=A0A914N941_MELIC
MSWNQDSSQESWKSLDDLAKINKMYNCQQQSQPQPQNTQQQKTSLIAQHAATKSKTQILPPFSLLIASEGNVKKGGVGNVGVLTKVDEKGKGKPQGINRNFQGVCEDKITVCWWTQDRCFAPNIFQIMRTLCPKTCRFC